MKDSQTMLNITPDFIKSVTPKKDKTFTPWGNYEKIKRIINSTRKYRTYIVGLSGCGKTKSIQQACAELKIPMVLHQITSETSKLDLIGTFKLSKGDYLWQNGSVVNAMLSGAVLILDEIDKANEDIMVLQGILNGDRHIFIPELGETIYARDTFQVFATANTKGRGDDTGLFNTSSILDGAFLDRFDLMIEQAYPDKDTEVKILKNIGSNAKDSEIDILASISERTRTLFNEDQISDVISTRQLISICFTKEDIFFDAEDPLKASLESAISRFDEDSREEIMNLYEVMSAPEAEEVIDAGVSGVYITVDDIPDIDFG
jgi:MoxR-like ATPase